MTAPARYPADALARFCAAALVELGVARPDAALVADCLVSANLDGVDTHGVARLPTYLRRIAQGAINAQAVVREVSSHGAVSVLDGDNALGPVAALAGMQRAAAAAATHGIGCASVRNSNHFAHAAYYCEWAAQRGLVGVCSSGGEPNVAPWGGRKAFFTNSPVAVAAPTSTDPVVVDFATSVSSRGNIMLAKLMGQSIPDNWAVDAAGKPTTDPAAALAGSVLPMGGAKGYAFIVALEILNGVLAGGPFAPHVGSQAAQDGRAAGVPHFFMALDPAAFMPRETFLARMDRLVAETRSAERSDPDVPILIPGERRRRIAAERRADGIPLPEQVLADLRVAAERYTPQARRLL